MFSGLNRRNSKGNSSAVNLGQIELEIDDAYIADKARMVARLDKESMKELHV